MRLFLFMAMLGIGTAVPAAEPKQKADEKSYEIPYRLTDTKHVMVRVKINDKGPFNLILDTGAPAMFVTKKVAKQTGMDEKGWAKLDKLVIEGGLPVEKARCRIEDLFQLEGMNSLGLAGTELHGVIGYELLARYRITYDFTKEKLTWVPLAYTPPTMQGVGGGGQGSLEILGPIIKVFGGLMGIQANFNTTPRGYFGVSLAEGKGGLVVQDVWAQGPADLAGLKKGDLITSLKSGEITNPEALHKLTAKMKAGDRIVLTISRGGEQKTVTVELGKGF